MRDCIIVDLDGTLCDASHREWILEEFGLSESERWDKFYSEMINDLPREDMVSWVKLLALSKNYHIIFLTARPERYRRHSVVWIENNLDLSEGDYDLIMRGDSDFRHPYVFKWEAFVLFISRKYHPVFVLDDDETVCEKFRENGITTLYCGEI